MSCTATSGAVPNDSSSTNSNPPCIRSHADFASLPFKSHPLYTLRKSIFLFALLGVLLCIFGSGPFFIGYIASWSFSLLAFSAFLSALDLICWATKKKNDPDHEPKRPNGAWAIVDVLMAVVLQFAFWATISMLADELRYSYGTGITIFVIYGILADLVCSILHACCFWKQLMSHKEKIWLAKLQKTACDRCGYTEGSGEPEISGQPSNPEQPNIFPYAGPSADTGRTNILTPETPESALEEGLLIGSDFGSGYGAVESYEPILEQPEEIVIGKGKKKAKSQKSRSQTPTP